MTTIRKTIRDWFVRWVVTMLWCGLLPIIVSAAYYALNKAPDFDRALNSASLEHKQPNGGLRWAIRIGGRSQYRSGLLVRSSWFGFNAEDLHSEDRAIKIANAELFSTYQATYIGRMRGMLLPIVACVFKDVAPNGRNLYEVDFRGSRPIGDYISWVAMTALAALAVLKIAETISRKKETATTSRGKK